MEREIAIRGEVIRLGQLLKLAGVIDAGGEAAAYLEARRRARQRRGGEPARAQAAPGRRGRGRRGDAEDRRAALGSSNPSRERTMREPSRGRRRALVPRLVEAELAAAGQRDGGVDAPALVADGPDQLDAERTSPSARPWWPRGRGDQVGSAPGASDPQPVAVPGPLRTTGATIASVEAG